jgi:hypothetical protein
MKPLTNIAIDKFFAKNPRYGGCYSRDDLPTTPHNKFYVINMDSESGPGTHWVALYCCHPEYDYYIDSFGVVPPEEVLTFVKSDEKKLIVNDVQIQSITSNNCGYFACICLKQLDEGYKLSTIILDHFTDRIGHSEEYINKQFSL